MRVRRRALRGSKNQTRESTAPPNLSNTAIWLVLAFDNNETYPLRIEIGSTLHGKLLVESATNEV